MRRGISIRTSSYERLNARDQKKFLSSLSPENQEEFYDMLGRGRITGDLGGELLKFNRLRDYMRSQINGEIETLLQKSYLQERAGKIKEAEELRMEALELVIEHAFYTSSRGVSGRFRTSIPQMER